MAPDSEPSLWNTEDPFSAFRHYLMDLDGLLSQPTGLTYASAVAPHLDGMAGVELRRLVPAGLRQQHSTYFTSSALRQKLISHYKWHIQRGRPVLDPACGVGDLLVGAGELLGYGDRFTGRAAAQLHGVELQPTLTEVAQRRLDLLGRIRDSSCVTSRKWNVTCGDGLSLDFSEYSDAIILLNPPFGQTTLAEATPWGSGRCSAAAPFLMSVIEKSAPNALIGAILPDALRSGVRYREWRRIISRLAQVEEVTFFGPFDRHVSTAVFCLHLRVAKRYSASRTSNIPWRYDDTSGQAASDTRPLTLSDEWKVSVGDVVPHRLPKANKKVPYFTVANVPIKSVIQTPSERIAWDGRTHTGPLILVRRTSRPGIGSPRVLASVYLGTEAVAIENHLIVLKPTPEATDDPTSLANKLRDPAVTKWLNERNYTRHLPARLLQSLPLRTLEV